VSAAFTPGPWIMRNWTSATVLARREHTNALDQTSVWNAPVAVAQPWTSNAERLANARLIAAAPDLYEAATEALKLIAGSRAEGKGPTNAEALLKLALAKARGEQVPA
jgi:hypothetical protein